MNNLVIARMAWSDEAGAMIKAAWVVNPVMRTEKLRGRVENEKSSLYGVFFNEKMVCVYALCIDPNGRFGREGVIEAMAGRLPGVELGEALFPFIERQFKDNDIATIRVNTLRKGGAKKLKRLGYDVDEWSFVKHG